LGVSAHPIYPVNESFKACRILPFLGIVNLMETSAELAGEVGR